MEGQMKKPDGVRPEPALKTTLQRTNNSTKSARFCKPDVDTTGILTDEEIFDLGRIRIGLDKAEEIIEHINSLSRETGLPLRQIQTYPLKLMSNDISVLMFAHDAAEQRIKAAAFAAVEGVAA